jgi:hypothetical protein
VQDSALPARHPHGAAPQEHNSIEDVEPCYYYAMPCHAISHVKGFLTEMLNWSKEQKYLTFQTRTASQCVVPNSQMWNAAAASRQGLLHTGMVTMAALVSTAADFGRHGGHRETILKSGPNIV